MSKSTTPQSLPFAPVEDASVFDSVHTVTARDISPLAKAPAKSSAPDLSTIVRILALLVCLGVLCYSLSLLIPQLKGSAESLGTYGDLSNQFWQEGNSMLAARPDAQIAATPDYQLSQTITDFGDFIKPPTYNESFEMFKARLNRLKQINKDIYGYIHIENTSVDYPLVQGYDNNAYLNLDFTGKFSSAGSIFVDYRNDKCILNNRNTIIYGHHMSSGSSMFHTLDYFYDKTFFDSNPAITIYTFDGIYHFEVFAAYQTRMDYHYIKTNFQSNEEFVAFCEEMRSNSTYLREGVQFDENSRILTLSTCTNTSSAMRLCVQAVLVNVEN